MSDVELRTVRLKTVNRFSKYDYRRCLRVNDFSPAGDDGRRMIVLRGARAVFAQCIVIRASPPSRVSLAD